MSRWFVSFANCTNDACLDEMSEYGACDTCGTFLSMYESLDLVCEGEY